MLLFPQLTAAQQLKEQKGNASYYADRFHGRRMSNGQIYHRDSFTCAHLRYPLGTWLLVRNLTNGKEVIVQVTDRGPYSRKFVIDLSRAAARELDIIHYGWRPVEIIPFVAGKIPYRFDPPTERPELDLGYSGEDVFEPPVWMEDSIYRARHRLSRTQVVALDPDSLRQVVTKDTTLHAAVKKIHKKK
ncbi:MAG: septal ring lytic transglycosylase RlpA family protein [Bacteroidaceae bacterium]|nr:septal ring lytic transglycosylase RlpA family protein [Bacteroidaceae bacterium]